MILLKWCYVFGYFGTDFFGSIPNAIFVAYAIVKKPHDELFICCMTLAYLYNNCSTFVNLKNNCMASLANAFVNGIFESYIGQCE